MSINDFSAEITRKAVSKSPASPMLKNSKVIGSRSPEIHKLVVRLLDPDLKTASPAGIGKVLGRIGSILQKLDLKAGNLSELLELLPFIAAKESELSTREIKAVASTLKKLATLVACRLVTKDVESDLNPGYADFILRNAAVPRQKLIYILNSPESLPLPFSLKLALAAHEVFSDYLKILENHLAFPFEVVLRSGTSNPAPKNAIHDFSVCDLAAFKPQERAASLTVAFLSPKNDPDLILIELKKLMPEMQEQELEDAVKKVLRATQILRTVILPALNIEASHYERISKFIIRLIPDKKKSVWIEKINQYSAYLGINSHELASAFKLYYLALTDRLLDSSEIPAELCAAKKEKLQNISIPTGKFRKLLKPAQETEKDSYESNIRVREGAFNDGLNLQDTSLQSIPALVWQQLYSRIGIVLNEYGQNAEVLKSSFSYLSQLVAEEFDLPLYQVKAGLNLFQVTINQMCTFACGTTQLEDFEDLKFAAAVRQTLQLSAPDHLSPELLRGLGGRLRLLTGLVAFDAKMAGIERSINYPLRNWIFHPDIRISERPVQSFMKCEVEILRNSAKAEGLIDNILVATAIPQEKHLLVKQLLSEQLTGCSVVKWQALVEDFSLKHKISSRAIGALILICCRVSSEKVIPIEPKSTSIKTAGRKSQSSDALKKLSQHIVREIQVDPQTLFFALCSLNLENDNVQSYREFGDRIIRAPYTRNTQTSFAAPLEIVKELIEESLLTSPTIRYDELFQNRLCDLLKHLCYRSYEGDTHKILEELQHCLEFAEASNDTLSSKIIGTLLRDITPRLIKLFSEIDNYADPETIKVKLLKEQIEGVVGAIEFNKPLLLYGTGAGKTEIAASYCEKVQAENVLWGTKTSSIYDTAERLQTKILTDSAGSVGVLNSDLIKLTEADFASFLNSNRYVVAGYDALRKLHQDYPGNYSLLQQRLKKGVKVLDELHVLDNPRSGMSKAVQGLNSVNTISLTATPFQHRPERVATILHLCLPLVFSDPQKLIREFKLDRSLIKNKISAYSTIYNITDLAKCFEESDRPLAEQISANSPRIPQVEFTRKTYYLSDEHSRLYMDLAFRYRNFAERNKIPFSAVYQVAMLQRLLANPAKFGAGPAYSQLAAAKEIALPLLEKGEKVLFFAYRRSTLDLIANDPEFKQHGIVLLDGRTLPAERAIQLKRLEEDPNCRCAAAQPKAAGSGSNCRSISQVIVLDFDRRWVTSDRIQAFGRPVRLLFPGDERFARLKVNITTLEPLLQPEVIAEITNSEIRKRAERGTIFSHWLERDERALQAFRYFTARGNSHARLPQASSATALVHSLKIPLEQISSLHANDGTYSGKKTGTPNFYNNQIKQAWRNVCHGEFLAREFRLLGKDPSELRVAHFAGPEALEIPWYLELGIKPQNIIGFSVGTKKEIEICRQSVLRHGCEFIGTAAQQALPLLGSFDIISIDPEGYSTNSLGRMIVNLKLADCAIIIKNSLASREYGVAKEMLKRAGTKRQYLDVALIKLCATTGLNPHNFESMVEALRVARIAFAASKAVADQIGTLLDLNPADLADLISDLYLGSWHLQAFSQLRYNSASGSPFLSTCARLEKWNPEKREGMIAIRDFVAKLVTESISTSIKTKPNEITATADKKTLLLRHQNAGIARINLKDFRQTLQYFSSKVPSEYRLRELLKYDVPLLKVIS